MSSVLKETGFQLYVKCLLPTLLPRILKSQIILQIRYIMRLTNNSFSLFFMAEEPQNLNPNAYLMQLVQKNPTITARDGNKTLAEDIKITQAYVILGTIADTMLRQMEGALKSVKRKAAIDNYWKNSATIASTSINYEKPKEEATSTGTQLFESNRVENQEDEGVAQDNPNNSGEKDDENGVGDIWESWKILLKNLQRPVLPVELFQELNKQVPNIKTQPVDRIFKQVLWEAYDTVR
ncbi:uncharacterized protein EV154DRAFT_481536 [Mucor mucedo]|uniref:uncharacterized protein n=1 Tax=Mucor mucedo TaxID=29922 RepID=UPI0022202C08|nr:uncharacterized protein EV154DRAFT_481536 [Mucor mucedo]KAI7891136.1 hypothetical protein EV154DRAFT_481536 [Mucor mucedo]